MMTPGLIDKAMRALDTEDCDSVMSVWKAQDDHPFRAMRKNAEGFAEPFEERTTGSNRQEYPDVFFYDQGIWAFKAHCAIEQKGPAPWVWLGQKCAMIERPWVTGIDVHSWIDISASSWYLNSIQALDYLDYAEE